MKNEFEDRLLAKLFGISSCCVDFYCHSSNTEIYKAPILSGGVRLCPACANLTNDILIRRINEKRICPTEYPTNPRLENLNDIFEDVRFTKYEVDWLMNNQHRFVAL